MKHEKDYSLLRPFDLEAAKRGEEIMKENHPAFIAKMAAISKDGRSVFAEFSDGSATCFPSYAVKMAPLAWVEGRPVYRGDVLYCTHRPEVQCIAEKIDESGWLELQAGENQPRWIVNPSELTWTPPMVKREWWGIAFVEVLAQSREEAEVEIARQLGYRRLSDVIYGKPRVVRIEWEEPAGEKK